MLAGDFAAEPVRVVAVALTRARELGFETVACASTGNLANAVAAAGARAAAIGFDAVSAVLARRVSRPGEYGARRRSLQARWRVRRSARVWLRA